MCIFHQYIFFVDVSFQLFCPFSFGFFVSLLSFKRFYFCYNLFIKNIFCKYLLPICGLSSHFLNSILRKAEVFQFNQVQLINITTFFFIGCTFGVLSKHSSTNPSSPKYKLLGWGFSFNTLLRFLTKKITV